MSFLTRSTLDYYSDHNDSGTDVTKFDPSRDKTTRNEIVGRSCRRLAAHGCLPWTWRMSKNMQAYHVLHTVRTPDTLNALVSGRLSVSYIVDQNNAELIDRYSFARPTALPSAQAEEFVDKIGKWNGGIRASTCLLIDGASQTNTRTSNAQSTLSAQPTKPIVQDQRRVQFAKH